MIFCINYNYLQNAFKTIKRVGCRYCVCTYNKITQFAPLLELIIIPTTTTRLPRRSRSVLSSVNLRMFVLFFFILLKLFKNKVAFHMYTNCTSLLPSLQEKKFTSLCMLYAVNLPVTQNLKLKHKSAPQQISKFYVSD